MTTLAATFKVKINQIDYTLAQPGPFYNSSLPRVPVIRIYGPSSVGSKTCVHVHQVYPYFFVEYSGKMDPQNGMLQPLRPSPRCLKLAMIVNRYTAKLCRSLNHAIAVSLKRNPDSPNFQYVRAVVLVKGVHFYGFHCAWSPFLKILIADPALVYRAVALMRSGTIMQTRFQIFESHLSFILQFMSDFGLYGWGSLEVPEVSERGGEDGDEPRRHRADDSNDIITFKPSPH